MARGACIILGVAGQGFLWQHRIRVTGGVRVSLIPLPNFCHLRKSGVNGAHDPPDYLDNEAALVLPI